jgi:RNA 2',3'-cyclic 3'-phosphodiesterase
MIRLFAALSLPPDIALALTARQSGLRGARWRPIESLHVTLRFFGEIAEDLAADLDAALAGLNAPAFEARLSGVGCFGEGAGVDAVWAGVADSPDLSRLARACETAARRAGLKPETRRYHPHVTLAYLRRPDPAAVAAWTQDHNLLASPTFRVDGFGLYSSWLGRDGSRYRLERAYALTLRKSPAP